MSDQVELQKIVGQVAAAYFSGNHVTPSEIPAVIANIAASIGAVGPPAAEEPAEVVEASKLTPAQIRRSVTRDAIISFEDNRRYKMLRRHLASRGMSPDEYRSKWGLPSDYPMVAPGYSETRSTLAKARGLGGRKLASTPAEPAASPAAEAPAPARPRQSKGGRTPARAAAAATPVPSVQGPDAPASDGWTKPRRRGPIRSRSKT